MAGIERGGQNIGRWPADMPDEEERSPTASGEGAIEGFAPDAGDAGTRGQQTEPSGPVDMERMAGLPEHERDTGESTVGGGIMSAGGTATEFGTQDSGDVMGGVNEDEEGESTPGLPMAGDTDTSGGGDEGGLLDRARRMLGGDDEGRG